MKKINTLFIISVVLFISIQVLVLFNVVLPTWITSYLSDFLCMPVVLSICLYVVQYLKKDKRIRIPLLPILALTTFYAVFFEAVLPHFHERYIADIVDVPVYFAGALLFYFVEKNSG